MNQLQMIYATSLVDSLRMYDKHQITKSVTSQKHQEQLFMGAQKAKQMQLGNETDVFTTLTSLFGCAEWQTEEKDNTLIATNSKCFLCAMSKKMNTSSPCNLYCLDPILGLIKGINPENIMTVESTLYDGNNCTVKIQKPL